MIDPNKLCPGCMKELEEGAEVCPNCGYQRNTTIINPRYLSPHTILGGKYLLGKVIGAGGFGITYLALDLNLNTKIAIKEYFPSELATRDTSRGTITQLTIRQGNSSHYFRKGLEQFMNEAKNLAGFNQLPGIVSVKDFFFENNTAYMVMEYIEGITLNEQMQQRGTFTWEDTLGMLEPVIKTLGRVHSAGMIHRDISPDNIMLTKSNQMKLIDFGAARIVDFNNPKSLTIMLKVGYAPEEQYRSNGRQGPWTDIYALSATMYKMMTGHVPQESLKRLVDGTGITDIREYCSDMPDESANAIMRGLSVSAPQRQQNLNEFYEELYMGKAAQPIPPENYLPVYEDTLQNDAGTPQAKKTGKVGVTLCIVGILVVLVAFLLTIPSKKSDTAMQPSNITEKQPKQEEDKAAVEEEEPVIPPVQDEPMIEEISEEEALAMYAEKCSIPIQGFIYDDFDADGAHELFIYACNMTEDTADGVETDFQVWFVNKEGAKLVGKTEDNWGWTEEVSTVQFGKTKHFAITKCGTIGSQGWRVTTFAYENGEVKTILQDSVSRLLSENGETFARIQQWQPYVSDAGGIDYQSYQLYYENGAYHQYQMQEITFDEFLSTYVNAKEVYAQAVQQLQTTVITSDMWGTLDLSTFPYFMNRSILVCDNGKIYFNFEQWHNETEAQAIYLDEYFEEPPCYWTNAVFQIEGRNLTLVSTGLGYVDINAKSGF